MKNNEWRIDRRTVLRGTAVGLGISGMSGLAGAKPEGKGKPDGPCFKDFACDDEDAIYVKIEFIKYYDEETDEVVCYFEEETDTGLVTIDDFESKAGGCEPIAVDWSVADGYSANKVMAYGGRDCVTASDPDPEVRFVPGLENPGGSTAAISNLQFCVGEATFPQCPFYGTTREDPTEINSIQYDSELGTIVETSIGDIPDDFPGDSNYPNGLAFDDVNDVWYFAEKDGVLKTMNEDSSLGIETYGVITPGGVSVAGAAFYDGLYYFIPNGGDELWATDISGGSASTNKIDDLNWSNIGLGDLAIDEDGMLYVSTVNSNMGSSFFSVNLSDTATQELISDGEPASFATGKQLAFENGTLWAHVAGGGNWYTVDLTDGSLSELVATTKEYTDLASCGEAEWEVQ